MKNTNININRLHFLIVGLAKMSLKHYTLQITAKFMGKKSEFTSLQKL